MRYTISLTLLLTHYASLTTARHPTGTTALQPFQPALVAIPPQFEQVFILPPELNSTTSPSHASEPNHASEHHPTYPDSPSPSPTIQAQLLDKRQSSGCSESYADCANQGQPGLCCPTTAACSADQMGNVGCCAFGAACTGVVGAAPTPTSSAAATTPAGPQTVTVQGGESPAASASPPQGSEGVTILGAGQARLAGDVSIKALMGTVGALALGFALLVI